MSQFPVEPSQTYNIYRGNRTPINQLYAEPQKAAPEPAPTKSYSYKKVLLALLITLFASFSYSSMSYSIVDQISSYFNMDLFNEEGEPSIKAIIMVSVVFFIITYILLYGFYKDC